MPRLSRVILLAGVPAMILFGVMLSHPRADASRAASAAPGQTLFGLDVPSMRQLDDSESALGARAAIVGTFADWAHTPQFPIRFANDANARGAVALISWEPWD